jgi:nucleoside-diphosphate-sugar epimerase
MRHCISVLVTTGDCAEAARIDYDLHAAFAKALSKTGKALIVSNGTGGLVNTGDAIAGETTMVDLDYPLAARNRADNLAIAAASNRARSMAIRLPLLVYGHSGNVFLPMLLNSARERGMSAYIDDGTNLMSSVRVNDAADLYVQALEQGRAGEVYIASAGADLSFAEVARAIATTVGCGAESVTSERAGAI